MLQHTTRVVAGLAAVGIAAVALSACSSDSGDAASADQKVTISVSGYPSSDKPESRKIWDDRIKLFEKANPNIDIEPTETTWDPTTFSALVAGGTLPTAMSVPYTNIRQLAENGQVYDISSLIDGDKTLAELNPDVQAQAVIGGKTYGIVSAAYTLGLVYNRALYTQAGLDPDDPPTTWDEVAENAQKIATATGQTGFSIATTQNSGGWLLTGMSYGFGSRIQNEEGTKAEVDSEGPQAALDFLQGVRWDDNAAGSNFLMTQDDMRTAVAAGQIGQTVLGADVYNDLVGNRGMNGADLGIAGLPQSDDGLGTLGGGTIQVVSPKATEAEAEAAVKWIKFMYLRAYTDKDFAIETAKARSEEGQPVGAPMLPVFNQEQYDTYLGWIADYVDVDQEQFAPYFDSLSELKIVPEPLTAAQETYALLDAAVQKVLTEKDTDTEGTLKQANTESQALIDQAQ
ncbi:MULTISPECIES: ABC transporter substrate-binding protein [unclassified Microbacterium]|uniref:ABC transporter substrate-binding protein n=1 Tax=unclassified Microbacterium TaxID=2609290 RepID=UPI0012FA920A|nr:extracellular solute-binding protein [Microbacterium sp. MAH-37]MVQ41257.1 extracellular solute-binding protein [Microbacterium sp. MAH-37]